MWWKKNIEIETHPCTKSKHAFISSWLIHTTHSVILFNTVNGKRKRFTILYIEVVLPYFPYHSFTMSAVTGIFNLTATVKNFMSPWKSLIIKTDKLRALMYVENKVWEFLVSPYFIMVRDVSCFSRVFNYDVIYEINFHHSNACTNKHTLDSIYDVDVIYAYGTTRP